MTEVAVNHTSNSNTTYERDAAYGNWIEPARPDDRLCMFALPPDRGFITRDGGVSVDAVSVVGPTRASCAKMDVATIIAAMSINHVGVAWKRTTGQIKIFVPRAWRCGKCGAKARHSGRGGTGHREPRACTCGHQMTLTPLPDPKVDGMWREGLAQWADGHLQAHCDISRVLPRWWLVYDRDTLTEGLCTGKAPGLEAQKYDPYVRALAERLIQKDLYPVAPGHPLVQVCGAPKGLIQEASYCAPGQPGPAMGWLPADVAHGGRDPQLAIAFDRQVIDDFRV